MGTLVEVGKTGAFKDGVRKKVVVQGHEIMLALVEGRFYATDSRCPHLRGDLSAGTLKGTVVTCPLQGSQFEISTGKVIRWLKESPQSSSSGKAYSLPKPLKTYNVRVEGDAILVEI